MLLGSDKNLEAFATPEIAESLNNQIKQALAQGIPPEAPVPVSFGILVSILVRLDKLEKAVWGDKEAAGSDQTEDDDESSDAPEAPSAKKVGRVVLPGGDDGAQ